MNKPIPLRPRGSPPNHCPPPPKITTPKAFKAWLEDLTDHGEKVARFLVDTMEDGTVGMGYRIQAASMIQDRLLGKVEQKAEVEHKFNPLLLRVAGLKDDELLALKEPEEPLPAELLAQFREVD